MREVHNVSVLDVGGHTEVSLHLKLPGELTLEEAHEVANQVESAIAAAVPGGRLGADAHRAARRGGRGKTMEDDQAERNVVLRIVREVTGEEPRELRFVRTDEGLACVPDARARCRRASSPKRMRAQARSRSASGARARTSPT